MSKLEIVRCPDDRWFVVIKDPLFALVKTKKEAWRLAHIRLQKLADNAKNKYKGMK